MGDVAAVAPPARTTGDDGEHGDARAVPPARSGSVGTDRHHLPAELVSHDCSCRHKRLCLEVRTAHAAAGNLHHQLVGSGRGIRQVDDLKFACFCGDGCSHFCAALMVSRLQLDAERGDVVVEEEFEIGSTYAVARKFV